MVAFAFASAREPQRLVHAQFAANVPVQYWRDAQSSSWSVRCPPRERTCTSYVAPRSAAGRASDFYPYAGGIIVRSEPAGSAPRPQAEVGGGLSGHGRTY